MLQAERLPQSTASKAELNGFIFVINPVDLKGLLAAVLFSSVFCVFRAILAV